MSKPKHPADVLRERLSASAIDALQADFEAHQQDWFDDFLRKEYPCSPFLAAKLAGAVEGTTQDYWLNLFREWENAQ